MVEGGSTWLIDTGFSRKAKPIIRALQSANVPLSSVTKILLTHHHIDHMGGAAFLLQSTNAPLSVHGDDAPFVDGRKNASMPLLMRLFVRTHPAPVAVALKEGDRIGPLVVVHTPGHTPGEVVFYHPDRKILFSGDAVVEKKGKLIVPAARFASDLDQAIQSLSRLQALDTEILLPGHGVPVRANIASLLDDLIRRAPAEYRRRTST
jgi:glyoxylase-like metal-dependent hydrolase (beta-lactamase superfamily II)